MSDQTGLRLNDESCEPEIDDDFNWVVKTGLDECGTSFEVDDDNQIVTFTVSNLYELYFIPTTTPVRQWQS